MKACTVAFSSALELPGLSFKSFMNNGPTLSCSIIRASRMLSCYSQEAMGTEYRSLRIRNWLLKTI